MDEKKIKGEDNLQNKKIRITITSRNVRNIERCSNELVQKAKAAHTEFPNIQVKGPVRMPTKHLKMTVRKSPCGEGSKTWDRYELRIHKRVVDLVCALSQLNRITDMKIDSGVEIEITFNDSEGSE